MRVKITSFRGHHEAVLDEPQVAKQFFDKMVGHDTKPLPKDFKVPDTFQELAALWHEGNPGFTAFAKQNDELCIIKDFDEKVEEVMFYAPIVGG